MYRVRKYKKYNRKKNMNKDLFFPSSYSKSNHMTYYQKKGMIIQKSPRLVFNAPTEIMSKEKLDAYYRTLLAYKYQIPAPPVPPIPFDIPPFVINLETLFSDYFVNVEGNLLFRPSELQILGDQYLQLNLPDIYELYNCTYDLYQLQFRPLNTQGTNTQFHIDWYTQQLNEPFQIFMKTVDATQSATLTSPICNVSPDTIVDGHVRFIIRRITVVSSGNFGTTNTTVLSNDTEISDNGTYSMVSSSPFGDQTGAFNLVINSGDNWSGYQVRSFVIVYATRK